MAPARSRAAWPCTVQHIQYLCVHARGVEKGPFSTLDVRIRWSEAPRFSQVPAWCGDVVSESMLNCQGRPSGSHQSIDRLSLSTIPGSFFFIDATHLAHARGCGQAAGRIGRGKKSVRSRDTGLRLIEKVPQGIYILAQKWNTTTRQEQIK